MTLLISGVTKDYAISTSDLRITYYNGINIVPYDEKFNKHIVFGNEEYKASITYTGIARWKKSDEDIILYEVISDSIANSLKTGVTWSLTFLNLIKDINSTIENLISPNKQIELHIVGVHNQIPYPFMVCISNFSISKPWLISNYYEWEYEVDGFNIFIKFADQSDFMIGGASIFVTKKEKEKLLKVLKANCDGFNIANLSSKIIANCSNKTELVGEPAVTAIIPLNGLIDFNLWQSINSNILGYVPRMIMSNGNFIGPSEFPVKLNMLINGHIPPENIFFRSIVYKLVKRRIRRIIFKNKKGKKVPGILGLLSMGLYGKVPPGYVNFFED